MDKRFRNYYYIIFDNCNRDYRIMELKCIPSIKEYYRENNSGVFFSCKKEYSECLEYELRKFQRRDSYCNWIIK